MTSRKVVNRLAPSDAAASSTSGSSSSSTGCTVRTMNGSVTNKKARNTATRVLAQLTPSGLDGPYRLSSTRPGDDGRQREGDVDHHLEHPLATKLVTNQHPGDHGAHDDVDRRHQHCLTDGQPERGQRLRAGQGSPVRRPAAAGSLDQHRGQRDQHQQAEPESARCPARARRPG